MLNRVTVLLMAITAFWAAPGIIAEESKSNTKWDAVRNAAKQEWSVEYFFRSGHDEIGHRFHRLSVNQEGAVKEEVDAPGPTVKVSRHPSISKEDGQRVLDEVIQQLEEHRLTFVDEEGGKLSVNKTTLRAGRRAVTINLTLKQAEAAKGVALTYGNRSVLSSEKAIPGKASSNEDGASPPKRTDERATTGCRLFESPPEDWEVVIWLSDAPKRGWRLAMKQDGTGKVSEFDDNKLIRIWQHLLTWEKAEAESVLAAAARDVSQFSFKESEKSEKQGDLTISLFLTAKERRIQFDESGVRADRLDATIASNILKAFRERLPEEILNKIPVLKPKR